MNQLYKWKNQHKHFNNLQRKCQKHYLYLMTKENLKIFKINLLIRLDFLNIGNRIKRKTLFLKETMVKNMK